MALFERALIEKYNQPGPRYTSYPTAPHLGDSFTTNDFERVLENSNQGQRPLSLYVHIPFCRSLCLYCACNVVITKRADRVSEYLTYLEREIDMVARKVADDRPVLQLHWGGGTPSYLTPDQIRSLGGLLNRRFSMSDEIEASVEIDPRAATREHLEAFREVGFNRVSFGVQDIHEKVQVAINRVQPFPLVEKLVNTARELGFESVNLDLIYGLPHQTPDLWAETLKTVMTLTPDRFAVFNYAHVPWMKRHQEALDVDAMPNADERLTILEMVIERLMGNGYDFIGMDHFARFDDDLSQAQREGTLWRNFQGYTTQAGVDLLGFGVTSLGLFERAYYQNDKELKDYYRRIDAGEFPIRRGVELDDEDVLRREVIMTIMCNSNVDIPEVEKRYGIRFWEHFADAREALHDMEADDLLTLSDEAVHVNERGRLFVRNIAMAFDGYLGEARQRFSRTV